MSGDGRCLNDNHCLKLFSTHGALLNVQVTVQNAVKLGLDSKCMFVCEKVLKYVSDNEKLYMPTPLPTPAF